MIVSVTPELGLDEQTPFAGGLGILEGDKFYAAARRKMDYTVVTLFYRKGYASYDFEDGMAVLREGGYGEEFLKKLEVKKGKVTIFGREAEVSYRIYRLGTAKAVFIDAIAPAWARRLNERLYEHSDSDLSFARYILLAEGTLDYLIRYEKRTELIDMQEAYATLLSISPRFKELKNCRLRMIIHTPGPWGHPSFGREFFARQYGYDFLHERVYLTDLGLATAERVFCVSRKHYEITQKVIPHFAGRLSYVTNGIEIPRWKGITFTRKTFRQRKEGARESLLRDLHLPPGRMLLAWNRRIVGYKRPEFMVRFIEECDEDVNFLLSGKAHPQDLWAREVMEEFNRLARERKNVYYTPEYSVELSKKIVAACDLLVFTPFSGWESSGTSFMKAMINGTPCLTSRDGAAIEFIEDGENGWLFGKDLRTLIPVESEKGREISKADYREFSEKLNSIISLWHDEREKFDSVALKAAGTTGLDMDRVMESYYGREGAE
ncbi:MAG: glycogen/starch/alpha-glucan phosphorylase [Methanomassiliicoccales archaeon]